MVFVQHANSLQTWYMHLKSGSIIVSAGDKVVRGQKLAQVGSSGNSSDAHLHFAVLKGPNYALGVSGGDLIDPWEGVAGNSDNLWSVVPPYAATVLNVMDADVSNAAPSRCQFTNRPPHVGSVTGPFAASDRIYVWVQIGGGISPDNDLKIVCHRPDNSVYDTIDLPDGLNAYNWPTYNYSLRSMLGSAAGAWRFDVLKNGQVEFSIPYNVLP